MKLATSIYAWRKFRLFIWFFAKQRDFRLRSISGRNRMKLTKVAHSIKNFSSRTSLDVIGADIRDCQYGNPGGREDSVCHIVSGIIEGGGLFPTCEIHGLSVFAALKSFTRYLFWRVLVFVATVSKAAHRGAYCRSIGFKVVATLAHPQMQL